MKKRRCVSKCPFLQLIFGQQKRQNRSSEILGVQLPRLFGSVVQVQAFSVFGWHAARRRFFVSPGGLKMGKLLMTREERNNR
jgi:hypothetical protein